MLGDKYIVGDLIYGIASSGIRSIGVVSSIDGPNYILVYTVYPRGAEKPPAAIVTWHTGNLSMLKK